MHLQMLVKGCLVAAAIPVFQRVDRRTGGAPHAACSDAVGPLCSLKLQLLIVHGAGVRHLAVQIFESAELCFRVEPFGHITQFTE